MNSKINNELKIKPESFPELESDPEHISELKINDEIRFTKILTKYSTEYNNYLFIQNLCQLLNFDKKDIFSFFIRLKENYTKDEIFILLEQYLLTKLDINRIYRYIEKFTNDTILNESDSPEDQYED